jgi:RNA exonuclease 4
MVGGKEGDSMLAQVSIVGFDGKPVYQTFVRPTSRITDYRTKHSGITAETPLGTAPTFKDVRGNVIRRLTGKVVVGFAIENDFKSLGISEEQRGLFRVIDVRELAAFQVPHKAPTAPTTLAVPTAPPRMYCPRLKILAWACLGRKIQTGVHDATEDAVTTLDVLKHACLVGDDKVQADLLRTMAEYEATLEGRNVLVGTNYEKTKKDHTTTMKRLKPAWERRTLARTQYIAAQTTSLAPEEVAKRREAFDDANKIVTELEARATSLRDALDRKKRGVDDARRAARNAIMFEGVDPNAVAPRVGSGAAARPAAAEKPPETRGGAGGPPSRRAKKRTNRTRRRN